MVTCQLKGLLLGASGLIVRVGPEEKSTCIIILMVMMVTLMTVMMMIPELSQAPRQVHKQGWSW